MNCDTYRIMDRGNIIARCMPLETALIMLKALLLEFREEPMISYTIEREPQTECKGEQE